jgi:hypothetical protein
MIPMWIVYLTPDNKVEAVEDNHSGLQVGELTREHNIVLGTPVFKDKRDAISWIETGMDR